MQIQTVWWIYIVTYTPFYLVLITAQECIHDSLQVSNIPDQWVTYDSNFEQETKSNSEQETKSNSRLKRANHALYSSIRISTFYDSLEVELTDQDITKLKVLVDQAVHYTSSILSVIPVQGPLLLKRTAGCLKYWVIGQNIGKCSTLDRQYKGEFCQDNLKIPDDHLESLSVWNRTSPEPVRKFYNSGNGVNTDFILYVRSLSTKSCISDQNRVLAYATYCRLDQNDRPVAGVINICPYAIRSEDITKDKIYQTVIHELFHALGFSKTLFKKFKDCSNSDTVLNCSTRSYYSLFREVNRVQRLATPMVLRKMKEHFNCTTEVDYGGPIKFQNGKETSHWEEKFMYGSIMTAKLGQPHVTAVDPITLAVLEDSGWYKVDYTKADPFYWGKGEGCLFGLQDSCQNGSQYFCTDKTVTGCHYLHKDKALCDVTDTADRCKVFQPKPQGECFLQQKDKASIVNTEIYAQSSRCFWSNLTIVGQQSSGKLEGRCYNHRCLSEQVLEIQIKDSSWIQCPYGEYISIPEYQGVIKCPDNKDILCPLTRTVTTSAPNFSTTRISGFPTRINIIFKKDHFPKSRDTIMMEGFLNYIKEKIINVTMVDSDRLQNIMIDSKEGVVMFDLLTSGDPVNDKTYQALNNAVVSGNFVLEVGLYGVSTIIPIDIVIQDTVTMDTTATGSSSSNWSTRSFIINIGIFINMLSSIYRKTI